MRLTANECLFLISKFCTKRVVIPDCRHVKTWLQVSKGILEQAEISFPGDEVKACLSIFRFPVFI